MNDTSIPQNVNQITITKTKSGFVIYEEGKDGYERIQHACTDDAQVNLIVNAWTNQKQYS